MVPGTHWISDSLEHEKVLLQHWRNRAIRKDPQGEIPLEWLKVKKELPLLSRMRHLYKMRVIPVVPWILQAVLMSTDSSPSYLLQRFSVNLWFPLLMGNLFSVANHTPAAVSISMKRFSHLFLVYTRLICSMLVGNEIWIRLWNLDLRDLGWEGGCVCVADSVVYWNWSARTYWVNLFPSLHSEA